MFDNGRALAIIFAKVKFVLDIGSIHPMRDAPDPRKDNVRVGCTRPALAFNFLGVWPVKELVALCLHTVSHKALFRTLLNPFLSTTISLHTRQVSYTASQPSSLVPSFPIRHGISVRAVGHMLRKGV
jgi:hypothetical protein